MRTMSLAPSWRVPAVGGELALILGISLGGLLVTAGAAAIAPGWVDVLNAWAWL